MPALFFANAAVPNDMKQSMQAAAATSMAAARPSTQLACQKPFSRIVPSPSAFMSFHTGSCAEKGEGKIEEEKGRKEEFGETGKVGQKYDVKKGGHSSEQKVRRSFSTYDI